MTGEEANQGYDALNPQLIDQISVAFDEYWERESNLSRQVAKMPPETRQMLLERDLRFADQVIGAVAGLAARHEGPITLLFDVDGTLVVPRRGEFGGDRDVIRPSATIIFDELRARYGERLNIGLLTVRGQNILYEQLEERGGLLEPLARYMTPMFVISANTDGDFDSFLNVVPPSLAPEDLFEFLTARKPQIIDLLLGAHPEERAFVVVDDHPWVTRPDPGNPRLVAVYASPEESAFYMPQDMQP